MPHIDAEGRLIHEHGKRLVLTCPHCQAVAHVSASAVPRFQELQSYRPAQIGIVFRCDACLAPIFLRFAARAYAPTRVELAPQFTEVEHPRERFDGTYLPEDVEMLFREALTCFTGGAYNAFASMCRRSAQALFSDLGEAGKLKLFDALNEVRELAALAPETFGKVRSILFGIASDPRPGIPLLDSYEAGVLLEVMKDLLYQTYVRKGRLEQAMRVRRFFYEEARNPSRVSALPNAG
jgi:hypothetical protein